MNTLLDLAARAVDAAKPGEHVEAFAEWGRTLEVKALSGEVESLSQAESRGLGVRVIVDGRLGYAYVADPDPAELADAVEQARTNAALTTPDEGNVLPAPQQFRDLDGLLVRELEETPVDAKVRMALDLERMTLAADPRVRGVDLVEYGEGVGRAAIVSTEGVRAAYERGDCWAVSNPLATQGDETQTGFSFALGRKPSDLDLAEVAREAVARAVRLFGAAKPKTEKMPVLLDPNAAASFLGVLASALTAEAVLKGRSLFAGRIGERVASEVVDLVDDGRLLDGPGAAPFDDEGVPTGRTPLIEGGVLKSYLHNVYTAKRMGGSSTGNARRAGFKSTPGVAPTNLFLPRGAESPEQLMRRAGRALYVQDLIGVHSGANPISGDFSVGVAGLIVDGGAFGQPVREAAVASTVTDILSSIVALGNDVRFFPFGGAIGAPTVLVGEMTVAGA